MTSYYLATYLSPSTQQSFCRVAAVSACSAFHITLQGPLSSVSETCLTRTKKEVILIFNQCHIFFPQQFLCHIFIVGIRWHLVTFSSQFHYFCHIFTIICHIFNVFGHIFVTFSLFLSHFSHNLSHFHCLWSHFSYNIELEWVMFSTWATPSLKTKQY